MRAERTLLRNDVIDGPVCNCFECLVCLAYPLALGSATRSAAALLVLLALAAAGCLRRLIGQQALQPLNVEINCCGHVAAQVAQQSGLLQHTHRLNGERTQPQIEQQIA